MPLLSEAVFPVCAPSLLNAGAPLHSPAELTKYVLIDCDGAVAEDWEFGRTTWVPRLGLDAVPPPRQLHFSQCAVSAIAWGNTRSGSTTNCGCASFGRRKGQRTSKS